MKKKKRVYSLISLQLYLILKGVSNFWIVLCGLVNDEFIESIASKSQRVSTKKQREGKSRQTARPHQSRYLSAQQRQLGVASSNQGN